jgi:hypothetical protein
VNRILDGGLGKVADEQDRSFRDRLGHAPCVDFRQDGMRSCVNFSGLNVVRWRGVRVLPLQWLRLRQRALRKLFLFKGNVKGCGGSQLFAQFRSESRSSNLAAQFSKDKVDVNL